MDFRETWLDGGIRVVTEAMPSVRSVALGFWFGIGSRDEDARELGAAHFLEHLLFKGTERRSAQQIAEELDAVGGEMNAFTSREYTCFYARVLDRDLPVAGDVLSDMLVRATNAAEDVESERRVVLEEINIHLDSPDELAHSDLAAAVFGDHPLACETLGTIDSITAMTREQLHAYYLQHYRPANLTVVAAGNLDHEAVVALVDGMLDDLGRPGGDHPRREPPAPAPGRVNLRHRPTEQAHVAVGGPGLARDDDRRYALRVLHTVLGGGMSSRLFQEIRERRGLAYSTYSYASSFTDSGIYGAYAGTTPARVDEVLKILRDELDGLAGTVTPQEIERAKGTLKGALVLALEDTGSRMTRLGKMAATSSPLTGVDEAIRRVDEVDLDAVRAVASEVLSGPRSVAVVGPFEAGDAGRFQHAVR